MTNEEAQKVLDELQGVRPEVLNDEAKRLFEAIMKIADERDLLKEQLDYVVNEYGATIEKQDKIINEMADEMADIDYDYESRGREMRTCCSKDCPKTDSRIIGQLCEWWYPYGNKTKCETMFKHWLENYDDVKKIHNEYL